jgi:3-dehydroquinate synthase
MQLKFRTEKRTKVRFFPERADLAMALSASDFLFFDEGAGLRPEGRVLALAEGEACKTWNQLEKALAFLAENGAQRSQPLVAIGGGAALDLSAMAASLYRRGIPLILVPTTLLAMVDATLGGKTAVDGPGGLKNFAGTFFPADEVWIHIGFLSTLPPRERVSGAGETWKTLWLAGKTADEALVEFVRSGRVGIGLERIIKQCLDFKRGVVEKDPLDTKRIRESLNYGHTVGHALEAIAGGRISHGEAVLWGMAAESGLLGKAGESMRGRVMGVIEALGLERPAEFSAPAEKWLPFLQADKKAKAGAIEMTVLAAPGKVKKIKLSAVEIAKRIKSFPQSAQLSAAHPPR